MLKTYGKAKHMNKNSEVIHFTVEDLPELATAVALSGSVKQKEVGGGICLGVAIGIAVYAMS